MRILNESAEGKTTSAISNAAANFYAVLPFTGGKGGAANLWRTALDENIAFTLEAFGSLRTTIARGSDRTSTCNEETSFDSFTGTSEARSQHPDTIPTGLGIGRLRCGVAVLVALLRSAWVFPPVSRSDTMSSTNTARAVQVPIGGLCHLGTVLLGCTLSDQVACLYHVPAAADILYRGKPWRIPFVTLKKWHSYLRSGCMAASLSRLL
jgi:hypothetical protein